MPKLTWDKSGSRVYETGIDRGVLYLDGNVVVPWNGLTSITENYNTKTTPIYFDGREITTFANTGVFTGTISAITYPDQFQEYEGSANLNSAVSISSQRPRTFNLSYRTQIGNDLDGISSGYKIHILYNVTAIPSDRTYSSMTNDTEIVEFEWDITAVPEEVEGFMPTAHITIDSRKLAPELLSLIETMLYGGETANPSLLPFSEFIALVSSWYLVEIVDNNDGTWTATSLFDGYIFELADNKFRIDNVNAVYLNATTYQVSDTQF